MNEQTIQLFESTRVRSHWDAAQEKWYFSVVDVVQVLTESARPRKYWSDLKVKLQKEGSEVSEKIGQLKMQASDGKTRGQARQRRSGKRTGQKVVTGSNFLPPGKPMPTQLPATPERKPNNSQKK